MYPGNNLYGSVIAEQPDEPFIMNKTRSQFSPVSPAAQHQGSEPQVQIPNSKIQNDRLASEPLISKHGGYRKLKSFQICTAGLRSHGPFLRPVHRQAQPHPRPDGSSSTLGCPEHRRGKPVFRHFEEIRNEAHECRPLKTVHIPGNCSQCRTGSHPGGLQPAGPPNGCPGTSI
jgi:hypothetical protein